MSELKQRQISLVQNKNCRVAFVFAPEERRNVATGETRGKEAPSRNRPGRGEGAVAPTGAKTLDSLHTTGFTRGYIPALLRSENIVRSPCWQLIQSNPTISSEKDH